MHPANYHTSPHRASYCCHRNLDAFQPAQRHQHTHTSTCLCHQNHDRGGDAHHCHCHNRNGQRNTNTNANINVDRCHHRCHNVYALANKPVCCHRDRFTAAFCNADADSNTGSNPAAAYCHTASGTHNHPRTATNRHLYPQSANQHPDAAHRNPGATDPHVDFHPRAAHRHACAANVNTCRLQPQSQCFI